MQALSSSYWEHRLGTKVNSYQLCLPITVYLLNSWYYTSNFFFQHGYIWPGGRGERLSCWRKGYSIPRVYTLDNTSRVIIDPRVHIIYSSSRSGTWQSTCCIWEVRGCSGTVLPWSLSHPLARSQREKEGGSTECCFEKGELESNGATIQRGWDI